MTTFGRYARFYDLLYRDKDYAAECDCLELLFARHARGKVRSVLDLGCGTGGHALLLVARGYRVAGVDRSQGMLAVARRKAGEAGVAARFSRGDIRTVRLGRTFDAVISMFAVLGYQTEDRDVVAALATAAAHLRPGGLLVFDVWFGPGVLADPPAKRVKRVAGEGTRLVRRTESTMDLAAQVVSAQQASRASFSLIGLAQEQVTAADEALRLAAKNLEVGTMTTLDVLQAQDAAAQARLRLADAVVRYNQAQLDLLAALGLLDQTTLSGDEV